MMLHDSRVCMPNLPRKERCDAVCHFVKHSADAPPVSFAAVSGRFVLLRPVLVIFHFKRHESFFMRLQNLRRDVVARATGDKTVLQRYSLAPIGVGRQQRSCGAKVDQTKVGIAS